MRKRRVLMCQSRRRAGVKRDGRVAGAETKKERKHKTKTKRGGVGGRWGGGDGSKPTIHKLYLPGQVIFLLSALKPIEEKFKESLTKGAKVTGDEETLMNRRELNKIKKF